jgi:WD40 repeat protein/tetratricopeptide (TPR) repeat protein/tRNA A-37 threonylcarbamoyl transferase component Bud32
MTREYPGSSPINERLEEVLAEILQAEEQGQAPDLQPFLERFPDLETPLRSFFCNRAGFARLAPLVAPTPSVADTVPGPDEAPAQVAPVLGPGSQFGGYEILAELGRGGMGIVYKARQLVPEREVALKVIRTDRLEELPEMERRQWIERFHREAQLVATLDQQAHIVTLYEVGEHQGQPYFTMRLLTGGSLAQRLQPRDGADQAAAADRRVRDQRAHAELLAKVAWAVDYAHRRGILHRDLKPANILLDAEGKPVVSDFGLARRLDQTGSLVASGIVGSAPYMPPEQAMAAPGAATTAADVYSLGAILYVLLTGQPPFRGKSDLETLLLVINQPPLPPRQVNPRLSRDLETICLKCLEKEPARRYRSAAELADDLDNWLAGRSLIARPAGTVERVWRWCKRNPAPSLAAAAVLLAVGLAFWLIDLSRKEAVDLAQRNAKLAEEKTDLADRNDKLAQAKANEAARATKAAANALDQKRRAQREATVLAYQQATTLCDQGEVGRGMHLLAHGLGLAQQAAAVDLERLFRVNLAAWRSHLHTLGAILPHPTGVSAVAFSPDGRTLATAAWDRTTRLWDAGTAKPRGRPVKHKDWVTGLAFSSDGKRLLTVGYQQVGVWEPATGKHIADLAHPAIVTSAAFGPGGRTVLTGDINGAARLWDPAEKKVLGTPVAHGSWIAAVAYSPDGRLFGTGGKNGSVLVWNAATRRSLGRLQQQGGVTSLAFSLDGRVLAAGSEARTAQLWDTRTGQALGTTLHHQGAVQSVALSPDGSLVLTGSLDRTARVWEVATGKAVGQPLAHPGEVLSVAFGPDGRTALTGNGRIQGDARLWDVALGNPLGPALAHSNSILALAVSSNSRRVATAGRDHVARLWDATTGEPVGEALPHNFEVNAVAFSPDGKTLVSGGDDGAALFWHAATGKPVVREFRGQFPFQMGVSTTSALGDGERSPFSGVQQTGQFWGPKRGKPAAKPGYLNSVAAVHAIAFSRDGKKLVTGTSKGAVLCDVKYGMGAPFLRLEVKDKEPFGMRDRQDRSVYAVAFSPDDRLVAVASEDKTVRLWDASEFDVDAYVRRAGTGPDRMAKLWEMAKSKQVAGPLLHGGPVVALAFSPDGKWLLTGSADKTARLWNAATGQPRLSPLAHQGPVVAVAFRPDGKVFVTGSWDKGARLWETATGKPVGQPLLHQGRVLSVAFSPDGQKVLTGSEDWTARLWDAATGQPVGPPLAHLDQVRAVAFRPDGRAVVTAGDDRTARLWPVPAPAPGTIERIQVWVEGLTGMRREVDGNIHLLDRAPWQATVRRLAVLGGAPLGPEDRRGWHRRQAYAAETAGQWLAARWHLDRLVTAEPGIWQHYLRRGKASLVLRQSALAQADFDKAIKLAAKEWEPWFQRGRLAVQSGRWQQSTDDLTKALELIPKEGIALRGSRSDRPAAILHGRGYARAALGRWKEAADDLGKAVSSWESTPVMWAHHALVLLQRGDSKRYGAACRQMLAKFNKPEDKPKSTVVTGEYGLQEIFSFGKPFDPDAAALMAWVCSLSRDAAQPSQPLELARKAAAVDAKDYMFARTLGAALYRAGQFEPAVKRLDAAQALGKGPTPSVWLLLAMAHHRCQRAEQAKQWLEKGRTWIEQARKAKPHDKTVLAWDRLPWTEWLALEQLLREAEKLIDGKGPKP